MRKRQDVVALSTTKSEYMAAVMQERKQYGYKDCVQVLGWYNKQ
jgi:hypothetical protein